jgi:hypothetical protein
MRLVSRRAVFRSFRLRLARLTLLGVYILTAAGIPLPAGNLVHKSGELFPCAECACGCATAEQCWRSCCCHSLAERMAWAREHGVRPPDFAIAEARRARIDVAWLIQPAGNASCCARALVAQAQSCCHAKHSCCADHHDEQPVKSQSSHVIGWKALNCKGHSADWIAAVPTLIPTGCGQPDQLVLVEWLGPALSECANRVLDLPAIPPPEAV